MRTRCLAGIALTRMIPRPQTIHPGGMTLIELVIVVAVMGILLAAAVPSYRGHMLRVHRSEAIRMLLQASMCQQRIYAADGNYDTSQCFVITEHQRYQLTFQPPATQGGTYLALATPKGAQLADSCGSLSLDQNGTRDISGRYAGAGDASASKCWNSR